ncbi:MAG: ATP-dependent metallopeptidase FtsH/Yme1/Tma family protein, partial [Azoarcus sp.]|nr:ATP-dependent metallopeptidase FtsH/Yme1/Tma family protein [Azoarcus sp.]
MNNLFKNLALWVVIGVVLLTIFNQFSTYQPSSPPMEYSRFMEEAKGGRIGAVTVDRDGILKATTKDGRPITVVTPGILDMWMVGDLMRYGVSVKVTEPKNESFFTSVFVSWFPMLLLIGVWVFFMRQMQGGGKGGAFSFGKSKARMIDESANSITRRCRRLRRSQGRSQRTGRIPARSLQIPETGRAHPQGRAD